jgi:hypothetical protein
MNSLRSLALFVLLLSSLCLSGCSTPEVQDARSTGLNNRQDRIDSRSSARQDRWSERAAREDARSAAAFDSW